MTMLDQKVNEYVERFKESVPVFQMPPMSDEELIVAIDKSLESGKPIEVEENEGDVY